MLSTLFLFSCANENLDPTRANLSSEGAGSENSFVDDSKTPYATISELETISLDDNNVHYKVACIMALQESLSEEGYGDYNLSKTPVIIYDVNNSPEYYEYRLKKGYNAYKSYAVSVEKAKGVGVIVKMDVANDYSANGNMKVVGLLYPSRYGLVNSNTRGSASTQKYYLPKISKRLSFNELMEGIIDDSVNRNTPLEYENIHSESQKNYEIQKQNNIDTYKNFEKEMQEVISMPSEEIEKMLIEKRNKDISKNARWHTVRSATAYKVYKETPNYWTTIKNFYRHLPHRTQRTGDGDKYGTWCGPVAFSMIMYGYHYKNDANALRTDVKYLRDSNGKITNTNDYRKINATNYGRYFYPASDINWRDGFVSMAYWEFNEAFRMFGKSLQGGLWGSLG